MSHPKITMVGAGSGFVICVARELALSETLKGSTFVLMDINPDRLSAGEKNVRQIFENEGADVSVEVTTDLDRSLDGADYVISACEVRREEFWLKDIEIPERHGVYQATGENGGPGGQIHALRIIGVYAEIADAMEKCCPDAWLMNFSNPMSYLCTYLNKYTKIRTLGFCHQVHGSFGVIAEQLGMAPGELEVITGGVNHFNWLMDIRRRGTSESCMEEFLEKVRNSPYWNKKHEGMPRQEFTLGILKTFGAYPVGYDSHIIEYIPFFYEKSEWEEHEWESRARTLRELIARGKEGKALEKMTLLGGQVDKPPFPRDDEHPYYAEKPTAVIEALETNTPLYLDAINIVNHGSIDNLPADAVVDVPAVVVGGEARGIHVGELPIAAMELCRRQITLHEMIAKACATGDAGLVVQSLCVDPYVRSITQARNIWKDYYEQYRDYLPQFAQA